ncbi:MAG: glycoside hydrolase family 127 protein [Kiritimatiellae bacterium]|nr:glycoside hydrolase family 127 protein [Kiritimatiellia bacterium]MDD5520875.1 glycoside hydrolase family 127 protein [Kiritimatiellia bacterium]
MNTVKLGMIVAVTVFIVGNAAGVSRADVTNHSRLKALPLGNITAKGWLKAQLERNKAGMGGHMDELEPEMIAKPYVDRNHKSPYVNNPGWTGEISGTYWAGFVQLAFTLDDDELKAKARKWVYGTLALQEEDGYLGSYRKDENRQQDYSAWSANWCYRALLGWYSATGDEAVLKAVHRGLLWFVKNWAGDKKTNYAGPTLMESMMAVYLLTGDENLYQWCLDYNQWLNQNDKFYQSMSAFQRDQLEYNEDHVVAFGENVKHPALIYQGKGQQDYLKASIHGIEQIMSKCWQCNGAPVSNWEYHSPPAAHHETEYCNFSTYVNTFSHMVRITGRAEYGDYMERILFNAAQGARKKDERAIAYMSSPNQLFATMDSSLFGCDPSFEVYAPVVHVACCPAQSVRIYPEYIRALSMYDADENMFLPAYGPCSIRFTSKTGVKIDIQEETAYPFDENIKLKIKASESWKRKLMLKIPAWCKKYRIELNGKPVEGAVNTDGYLPVENDWHDDTVSICFEMTPRVVPVKDVYFQKEPLRAIECGPLLFSLRFPENWKEIKGTPKTPLPQGWSWYEASYLSKEPFYSLDLKELNDGAAIVKQRCESNYPWDNSPLKLKVPMHRSQRAYQRTARKHTGLAYDNPVTAEPKTELVELVPYGCTILRLTCFTICK